MPPVSPPIPLDDVPLLRGPFLFLRHGESTANRAGLIAGWRDPALTELGLTQAREAAEALRGQGVGRIFASPLRRAWDTAQPTAGTLGLSVTAVPGLMERNWGEMEGRPIADRPHIHIHPPGGESWEAFSERVWRTLADLPLESDPNRPMPLIVAHAGVMRVLRHGLGRPGANERVANGRPIRFDPPGAGGNAWVETMLEGPDAEREE